MNLHKPIERKISLINISKKFKEFIADHCQLTFAKEDYCEFLSLEVLAVCLETKSAT